MKIIEVEVSYAETCSMEGYNNVRPSVRYAATIEESESFTQVRDQLFDSAKAAVRQQIDLALEANNQAPKYYGGPRFDVAVLPELKAVVLHPTGAKVSEMVLGFYFDYYADAPDGMRYSVAFSKAHEIAIKEGYKVIDCHNGDYSQLMCLVTSVDGEREKRKTGDIPF